MIIYKAENIVNGKMYIGKTIRPLEDRINGHFYDMKRYNYPFYNALEKYGKDNFSWEILTETDSESKLNVLEKFYIACYRRMGVLYNLTDGGDGCCWNKGKSLSEEHKIKIRQSNIGLKRSEETKEKVRQANLGKKHSEETKRKMSEKHKGYKFSDESKLKMRKSAMGRIISQEQRNKISLSLKNYYLKSREV